MAADARPAAAAAADAYLPLPGPGLDDEEALSSSALQQTTLYNPPNASHAEVLRGGSVSGASPGGEGGRRSRLGGGEGGGAARPRPASAGPRPGSASKSYRCDLAAGLNRSPIAFALACCAPLP